MSYKHYVIKKEDGSLASQRVKGFVPKGVVGIMPEGEEDLWIELVDELDAEGNPIKVLKPNIAIKDQVLADRQAEKDAQDAEKASLQAKEDAKKLIKDTLRAKGPADLGTLAEIRAAVLELIELIK